MPFGDEYPLDPVDTEAESEHEEPWEDRDLEVEDLQHIGADMEADTVRALVQEQVDTWRRVPYLLLEAEGRKRYNVTSSAALRGYYKVIPEVDEGAAETLPNVYVDCASGELVSAASVIQTPPIAENAVQEAVIDVLEANGDEMEYDAVAEELTPRYEEEMVEEAIQELYWDGLATTPESELKIQRPNPSPAPDHVVERMAAAYPERLDAERTVEQLEERANEPRGEVYDPEKEEAWRERVREQLDLDPVFTRD